MALISVSRRPWYVNKAGTKWVRDPEPVRPKREPVATPEAALVPLLKSEAEGDLRLAVLLAVRNLLRDPEKHTGAARALDAGGNSVDPGSIYAVRWNISGALINVSGNLLDQATRVETLALIKRCLPRDDASQPLFQWEAHKKRKHSQVIHLLNMAVAARKKDLGYL